MNSPSPTVSRQVELMLEQLFHNGSLLFGCPNWWDMSPESIEGRLHVPTGVVALGRYIQFYGHDGPPLFEILNLNSSFRGSRSLTYAEPFIVQFSWPGYSTQGSLQVHGGTSLRHLLSRVAWYVQWWLFNPARGSAPTCELPQSDQWHPCNFDDKSIFLAGLIETVDPEGDSAWAPDLLVRWDKDQHPQDVTVLSTISPTPFREEEPTVIYLVSNPTCDDVPNSPVADFLEETIQCVGVEVSEDNKTDDLQAATEILAAHSSPFDSKQACLGDILCTANFTARTLPTAFPLSRNVQWSMSYPNQTKFEDPTPIY